MSSALSSLACTSVLSAIGSEWRSSIDVASAAGVDLVTFYAAASMLELDGHIQRKQEGRSFYFRRS